MGDCRVQAGCQFRASPVTPQRSALRIPGDADIVGRLTPCRRSVEPRTRRRDGKNFPCAPPYPGVTRRRRQALSPLHWTPAAREEAAMEPAVKDASHLYEVERRARHAERPGFRITELQISPAQQVPWHYHSHIADTFYVLEGTIRV